MSDISLEEAESLSEAWNDAFVRRRGWQAHDLCDPVDAIAMFAAAVGPRTILDAGCGWARYAHRFLDAGLAYVGIDHSAEAIALARVSNPGLRFEIGSVARLPFASESFAGLWSCCVLGSVPKAHIEEVLREHARVLRPDGRFMCIIPYPPFGVSEEVLYPAHDTAPAIYQAHYELDEFCTHLERAGFRIEHAREVLAHGSQEILARLGSQ